MNNLKSYHGIGFPSYVDLNLSSGARVKAYAVLDFGDKYLVNE